MFLRLTGCSILMKSFTAVLSLLTLLSFLPANGQDEGVEIIPTKITDTLYLLQGKGWNIGLSIGDDGPLMIDDQFAPLSEKIMATVATLSDQSIRFVINTHWHGDHTGGNENLGKAGAIIVAHENVRVRMSKGQFMKAFNRHVNPAPEAALPVVTFPQSMTIHWNGDELAIDHLSSAHTDGDAVIHFKKANVLHTGDLFFNGFYPFVDASSGGSFAGLLNALNSLAERIDDETVIIPGHGPLAKKADLLRYITMLETVQATIGDLIEQGQTKEEIIAAKPTAEFDADWGGGFLAPDIWVGIVYDAMVVGE